MKKIIKAHKGFAHVPQPSSQQAPSKAKGTAGTAPRRKRMIGLPQQFRGGRRRAPMPQAPAPVRRAPAMQEPKVITQPKPVVRPPRQSDAGGGRGVRPVMELPNKGRGKNQPYIRKTPKPIMRVQAPPPPKLLQPRILNQGGYMSRASYGIVDNLKGK
mgnify:CR=1 FL=1